MEPIEENNSDPYSEYVALSELVYFYEKQSNIVEEANQHETCSSND